MLSAHLFCSNKCKDEWRGRNEESNSQSNNSSSNRPEIDYDARIEEARLKMEKERHEAEMDEIHRQRKQEEERERKVRADALREQGKPYSAFYVQYSEGIWIFVFMLAIGIYFLYSVNSKEDKIKEANQICIQLETIEDQIKIAIQNGDKEKALELTNKLIHPLHEKWEDNSKKEFWKGYPYYDEWWSNKREEYKNQILGTTEEVQ